jgi:hypothetical protein
MRRAEGGKNRKRERKREKSKYMRKEHKDEVDDTMK